MLPNFLVIGARRAGTTWLHRNLSQHPQVFMPTSIKELHFFDRHFDKGIEYYQSFFESANGYKAIGEATPAYLHTPDVCQRIHDVLPNAKLIAILRDPVDRLYSNYIKGAAKGSRKGDLSGFEQAIRSKPAMLVPGYYVDHLKRHLEKFTREQILVLLFDELQSAPESLYHQLLDFLGIDTTFQAPFLAERINSASAKKYMAKSKSLYYIQIIAHRAGFWKVAMRIENFNRAYIPDLHPDIRKWLIKEVYGEKNQELEKLLNLNVSHWNRIKELNQP